MVLASAVSSGVVTAMDAWPEFFTGPEDDGGFPSSADSGFELEHATPESFAADMAALVAASQKVVIREGAEEPPFPRLDADPEHQYFPGTEWT